MTYTKFDWRSGRITPVNEYNLDHIEQGIYDAHELHRDLISGVAPTYSGWTVDPTDGADITDGDPSVSCTTGNKVIGAGWQYAYFEWDLGALYDVMTGGFGGATATVGTPYTYVEMYVNAAWYAAFAAVSNWTDRPFMAVSGRCSKVRLGITSDAAATIAPDIREFNVWRMG